MPILFPAIDLKNGECVRLKLGDMNQATVYNADPTAQARAFRADGFTHLHVVDLDGAFSGKAVNGRAVETILAAVGDAMKVQLGGGIRTVADVERWLALGLHRVILGTVAVEGWAEASELTVSDLAKRFVDAGVAAIVYTDIDRDGILAGINWDATIALAREVPIPVIASGGLASMDDIRRLGQPDAAILEGAISGRALYDGRIEAREALDLLGRAA